MNIETNLHLYHHFRNWSYYDRDRNPAPSAYHLVHIQQLKWITERRNSSQLTYYMEKWNNSNYKEFPRDGLWYISTYLVETRKYFSLTLVLFVFEMSSLIVFVLLKKKCLNQK